MKRQNPEQRLHREVADYCHIVLPPSVVWTTFPSGGGGKVRGGVLRGLGLLPGVSDMVFMWAESVTHTDIPIPALGWLELKSPEGRMSPEQIEFANRVQRLGHRFVLARSLDYVRATFAAWGIPTREAKDLGYRVTTTDPNEKAARD